MPFALPHTNLLTWSDSGSWTDVLRSSAAYRASLYVARGVSNCIPWPHAGKARRLKGHRWLVVACDTKVLMYDLAGSAVHEIPRSLTDSKGPTCLAILYLWSRDLLAGDFPQQFHCWYQPDSNPAVRW